MQSKYNVEGEGEYILRFEDKEFRRFVDFIAEHPFAEDYPELVRIFEEAYQRGVGTGDLCATHWFDHGAIILDDAP